MRRRSATLTAQELEIMKIVWRREPVTVRDVYEALLEQRKVAYTTVMTMMKILEQKKYLKKTLNDRAYVYRPAQPQRQVVGDMVRDFVNRVFNGAAEPLLVHLVEEHNLSREDLDEISRLREASRESSKEPRKGARSREEKP
jgi:predicted transcriptional regulator